MAVEKNLVEGEDGVVRGAEVRVITKGRQTRMSWPLQKLYPIEASSASDGAEPQETTPPTLHVTPTSMNARPNRAAAKDAGWKTHSMLDPY